jgi:ZIP family zinc transporter
MTPFVQMLVYTLGASACIPAGALLARVERIHPRWLETEFRHFVMAFGGGVLLAAVALVLLPQGMQHVPDPLATVGWFLAGGLLFFALEWRLGQAHQEHPQLLATLLDYLPESLALGGAFALGSAAAPLLAVLIGLQNLPEGFNAYREQMAHPEARPGRVLWRMVWLVPLGPLLATVGWFYLAQHPAVLGATMLVDSGGILYLLFQDIAPMARLRAHWFPPLGAVCGFAAALLGQRLVGLP